MEIQPLSALSDRELLAAKKKARNERIVNGFITGFLVGISVYALYKKGLGFFTFLPLLFAFLLIRNYKKSSDSEKELDREISLRKLNAQEFRKP